MISRRRFVIQLTPLFDLLIILVFALLLGLRQQARTEENRSRSQVTGAVPELADESDPVASLVDRHKQKARDLEKAQSANANLNRKLADSRQDRQRISDLVKKLFQVPPETLTKLLRAGPASRSQAEQDRLQEELRELAEMKTSEVVKHLVTFDAMRKRLDLWDLVVGENHRYELKAGGETKSFQAKTPDEFEEKLFRAYKELAQPKDLVILMLAWQENADFSAVDAADKRLQTVIDRMKEDRSGQTQFYHVKLGLQDAADNR